MKDAATIFGAGAPLLRTIGLAIYLGCSWTWCIGMFLPVLLVRDFGIGGWIVFAIPNVIGAAAMGWVVRSPEQSRRMVEAHWPALRWFSLVTIAFQIYFAGWFFSASGAAGLLAWILLLFVIFVFWISTIGRRGSASWAAAGALAVSLACFAFGLVRGLIPALAPMKAGSIQLLPLALVCSLGFATCPYLDLTFHRARRLAATAAQARAAFGIGFGIVFLAMIVFTLCYTGLAQPGLRGAIAAVLFVHMAVQLGFTVAMHARELEARIRFSWRAVAALIAGVLIASASWNHWTWHSTSAGELIYRAFMGFYGLVFPAYVWICILGSPMSAPQRRTKWLAGIAIVVALPFYWLGFIQGWMLWLLPGLAIVLLARYLRPRADDKPGNLT